MPSTNIVRDIHTSVDTKIIPAVKSIAPTKQNKTPLKNLDESVLTTTDRLRIISVDTERSMEVVVSTEAQGFVVFCFAGAISGYINLTSAFMPTR